DAWVGDYNWGAGDYGKDAAVNALKALDDKRLPEALIMALKSKTENVRWWAAASLGGFPDDSKVVEALIGIMGDRVPVVRKSAAESLGKLEDKAAIPVLVKALDDKD